MTLVLFVYTQSLKKNDDHMRTTDERRGRTIIMVLQ